MTTFNMKRQAVHEDWHRGLITETRANEMLCEIDRHEREAAAPVVMEYPAMRGARMPATQLDELLKIGFARMTQATEDYRARLIEDAEYLAARKAWTELLAQQDEADGTAQRARDFGANADAGLI